MNVKKRKKQDIAHAVNLQCYMTVNTLAVIDVTTRIEIRNVVESNFYKCKTISYHRESTTRSPPVSTPRGLIARSPILVEHTEKSWTFSHLRASLSSVS